MSKQKHENIWKGIKVVLAVKASNRLLLRSSIQDGVDLVSVKGTALWRF